MTSVPSLPDRCLRRVLSALAVLCGVSVSALAGGRTAVKELLLSGDDLGGVPDLTGPSRLGRPLRLGERAGLRATIGDLKKVDGSRTGHHVTKLTDKDELDKVREILKVNDLTNVGDLFKAPQDVTLNNKTRDSQPSNVGDEANVIDVGSTSDPSDHTATPSPAVSSLAKVGDLTVEVRDLTPGGEGRTVGRSGRVLPAGLVRRGSPYETWSSYRGRLEADRRRRLHRQRRAADTPHSRQKRFLTFPTGSILYVEPNVYIPVYRSRSLCEYAAGRAGYRGEAQSVQCPDMDTGQWALGRP